MFNTIVGLIIALMSCSGIRQTSMVEQPKGSASNTFLKSKYGLKIEYGPNLGMIDTFAAGNYIHITATITNDTTIPIHLFVALSKEYHFPDPYGNSKFKIFLLPKELTPDTATLYGKITEGLGDFLDHCLETPYNLRKTLKPGEFSVITIGTLIPRSSICTALPRAVFAQMDGPNFQGCDSLMKQHKSTIPIASGTQFELGLKLVFYSGRSNPETCMLLTCGHMSYAEP